MIKNAEHDSTWAWATGALWMTLTVALLITMSDYGMSWDEITRWNSGDNKLGYYEKLFGEEGMSIWGSRSGGNLYPGLFDLPLAVYAKYVGGDRVAAGHLYTMLFGVLSVVGTGMIAREIGGWSLAFWASLLLMVLPRFYGHLVFNPKDIPFAATYTWGVWGVLRCAAGFDDGKIRRWFAAGALAGLAMATRLPGMIIIAYLIGLSGYRLVSQILPDGSHGWRLPRKSDIIDCSCGLIIAVLTGVLILMIFFPSSHANPFTDSVRVVDNLHVLSTEVPVLFRGAAYVAGDTPWYYVPWMIAVTMPVWQLTLLGLGIATAFWQVLSSFLNRQWWDLQTVRFGTVLLAFGFPLLYLLLTQPAIHNGVRHFLFVLPAGVVLMAFALHCIANYLMKRWRLHSAWVFAIAGFFAMLNVSYLIRLHPYQYVYFNQLAGGPAGALGQYETEYWFTSMGEGIERLMQWRKEQGMPVAPVEVLMTGPREIAEYQLPQGWALVAPGERADYFLGNTQFAGHLLVDGEEILVIERMGLPILVVKDLSSKPAPKR